MAVDVLDRQRKQSEWHDQWSRYEDKDAFLFFDWIAPRTLDDFREKRVLDAGCGPGHHVRIIAPVADHVTGVDLNTSDTAADKLVEFSNVTIREDDIARYSPDQPYDVV